MKESTIATCEKDLGLRLVQALERECGCSDFGWMMEGRRGVLLHKSSNMVGDGLFLPKQWCFPELGVI